jgi:hypothetical protein
MTSLEDRLTALRRHEDWPETPDVVPRVVDAIRAEGSAQLRARDRRSRRPRLAGLRLAAATLAALLVATAAVPPARSAVLRWLGIEGARVHRVKTLPRARTGAPLHLGERASLAKAQRAVRFRIRQPAGLGRPDRVLLAERGPTHAVTLVYRPTQQLPPLPGHPDIGLLLTEFIGRSTPFIDKMVLQSSRVVRTDIDGERGYWLEDPHVVIAQYGSGDIVPEPRRRVAGDVLLWESPPVSLRLESRLSRKAGAAMARRLR